MAIISGIINNFGMLLVKYVVNKTPKDNRKGNFNKILLKNPIWWLGQLLALGVGTIFFIIAQNIIGPSLVPGLMASGLIVLALGSIKLNKENITKKEFIGIILMIVGVLLLGLSKLDIPIKKINIFDESLQVRISIFTIILFSIYFSSNLLAKKSEKSDFKKISPKGVSVLLAESSGVCFTLSNFWIAPLLATINIALGNLFSFTQNEKIIAVIIFIISALILVLVNIFGVLRIQESLRFGQASNLIPLQQVPIQIGPIFVYFSVFMLSYELIQIFLITIGVFFIITAGFLLGERKAQIDQI